MRFAKFILIVTLAFSAGLAFGQNQAGEAPISAERDLSHSIYIFPNPAVEYVHVKTMDVLATKVKLAVHNILGSKMEVETEIVDEHELRIKVKDLSSGYYLLAIKDDDAKIRGTFKFLKR